MKAELFKPQIILDRTTVIPLRAQIIEQVRKSLLMNRPDPGTKIVSERQLADELEVNRNTIHQAYEELLQEGLLKISQKRRDGMVVAEKVAEKCCDPFPALNLILPYNFSEYIKHSSQRSLEIIAGIMDRATELNISVHLIAIPNAGAGRKKIQQWLENIVLRSIGSITFGLKNSGFDPVFDKLLKNQALPHVFITGYSDLPHISSVTSDIRIGAGAMIEYLRKLNHRHLGVVALENKTPAQFNFEAFERGRIIAGMAETKGMKVTFLPITLKGGMLANPCEVVTRILACDPMPSVFWTQNDSIAGQIINELRRHDIHVPRDFSLIGYDNLEPDGKLSSINHSSYEIGSKAVDIVCELFHHGQAGEAIHVQVPSRFIIKKSIKAVEKTGE